ncbi:MAG: imidazole glycerol phosphate synthase subunit HisF [Crocinitomicaceae bacterium]|nr:imidazole glycerol phosphate synthase subunit HisF [Crocinitomicaceae bacterium]
MLKKRIIPCLDIQNGRTVKGVNFVDIVDAGDPIELARRYVIEGADELVFLDISATIEKRKTLIDLVSKIAREINIPFTVGGGIASLDDVRSIIGAGADKVSLNSAVVDNPDLIRIVAKEFGSQCVVVAVDTKLTKDGWKVFTHGGRTETKLDTLQWTREVEQLGAGEILLTSMNNDGTKDGFALEITAQISEQVNIPVIGSGGAGRKKNFKELFEKTAATGGLAASIFHFGEVSIPELKEYLINEQIPIRK